eukprot:2764211-Rhodomonas_salina.1
MGARTIKDGEAAAIWDIKGRHRQVIGPSRQWTWLSTIRFLTRHKAESHQFILVRHRNGKVEHIQGPAELHEDAALYDEGKVQGGIELCSDTECIIVYRQKSAPCRGQNIPVGEIALAEEAVKRVVKGPTLSMLAVGETVHGFKWSGIPADYTNLKRNRTCAACCSPTTTGRLCAFRSQRATPWRSRRT